MKPIIREIIGLARGAGSIRQPYAVIQVSFSKRFLETLGPWSCLYQVPEGFDVITALAIGYAADPESLPDRLKERDQKPRQRRPLSEFVFDGEWGTASAAIS